MVSSSVRSEHHGASQRKAGCTWKRRERSEQEAETPEGSEFADEMLVGNDT